MKKCKKCGTSLAEGEKKCIWCGTKVKKSHKGILSIVSLAAVLCIAAYIILPKKVVIGFEDGNLRIKTKIDAPVFIEKKDYNVEFVDCSVVDGDKVVITYKFTNNTEKSSGEFLNITIRAFQDGLEINEIYDSDLTGGTFLKNIQAGATVELKKAFKLTNTESPIVLEATEFAGDVIAKEDFKITH
nr:DUF5067 domain-containing protein [uncultured Cellulosilyticum sp.]